MKNATGLCLSGHWSEVGTLLRPGHPSVQEGLEGLEGLVCGHNSSREASALHKLLESVEDAVSTRVSSPGTGSSFLRLDPLKRLMLECHFSTQVLRSVSPGCLWSLSPRLTTPVLMCHPLGQNLLDIQ